MQIRREKEGNATVRLTGKTLSPASGLNATIYGRIVVLRPHDVSHCTLASFAVFTLLFQLNECFVSGVYLLLLYPLYVHIIHTQCRCRVDLVKDAV